MLRFLSKNVKVVHSKCNRQMSVMASSLQYSKFGDPSEVLSICEHKIEDPVGNEVLIKVLASPINPADINIIQGKYPVKPKFPATGGNECVAEVVCFGDYVKGLNVGDWVIPSGSNLGVWTTYAKFCEKQLIKVSKKIGLAGAATLSVNPCTAYRMIKDFVELNEGDTVVQNGANSGVGQAVHQLCKAWDLTCVGVVRDRPEISDLKNYLKELGAAEVLTEEELRKTDIFKCKLEPPRLALNCVGGKSASELSRHLNDGGIMVTYGGMSREPVNIPTGALIFKDITFEGFWMTRWTKKNFDSPDRKSMFAELTKLMESCKLKAPVHELVPFQNYKGAVEATLNFRGFNGRKLILDLQN